MLQSLLKRFSPYIIVAVVAYVAGHQLASQMNEEKIVTVVQDRETVRTIIKERPDGSKETIIVEDRTSDRSTVKSSPSAGVIAGVNSLLLSAANGAVADIVALGATPTMDGIVNIPGNNGAAAFAVATVNVGAGASITVSANTGDVTLPVQLNVCESNPADGQCLSAPAPSVTTTISGNATPTFSVFIGGTGNVAFDPANHRINVVFEEGGQARGATSVAVRTQ